MNNPASAEGFTVIFNKARDEKRTAGTSGPVVSPRRNNNSYRKNETYQPKRIWKSAICFRERVGGGVPVGASIFAPGKLMEQRMAGD
ncbi:hypothetical protein ACSBR2_023783 [Camellia fascicularis]